MTMTHLPPVKHKEIKVEWMFINQNGKCSGCHKPLKRKPDFAHIKPRTEDNYYKYPNYIDSILNATCQCNGCNVGHINQNGKQPPSDLECKLIEQYLIANPNVSKWCNMPDTFNFNFYDVWAEINQFIMEHRNDK